MGKKEVKWAMKHKNVLGAGAMKRKHLGGADKVHTVMAEYKRGTLHSGSGDIVTNRKQAIAIAMSEAGKSKKRGRNSREDNEFVSRIRGR